MIVLFFIYLLVIVHSSAQRIQYQQLGPSIHSPAGVLAISKSFNLTIDYVPDDVPIIKIGFLLTLTGADSISIGLDYGAASFIQMMVDVTNARGGVWMAGKQHRLSVLIHDEQGSSILANMAVRDMVQSQSIHAIALPVQEFISISLLQSSQALNVSFVTSLSYDTCVYRTNAQNLFGFSITSSTLHYKTLDAINHQAKLFYPPDLNEWPYSSTGYVSPFGITTMCIFEYADTAPCEPPGQPLIEWIMKENANRSAAGALDNDLINHKVIVMSPFASYTQQIAYWKQCPDLTDAVGVPLRINTGLSLSASQRRFKAVFATEYGVDLEKQSDADRVRIAAGWIFTSPIPSPAPTTLPGFFSKVGDVVPMYSVYERATSGVVQQPSALLTPRAAEFSILMAALNASNNLSRDDFRRAILSLTGLISVMGPLSINQTTGENQSPLSMPANFQVLNSGVMLGLDASGDFYGDTSIAYPFPFPYLPPKDNAVLETSQTPSFSLGAVIVCGFSIWIGHIMFEHGVVLRERGSKLYLLWIFLSSEAVGGVGVVSSYMIYSLSLRVSIDNSDDTFELAMSAWLLWTTWVVAVCIIFVALLLLSYPVRSSIINPSMTAKVSSSLRLSIADNRKATLSRRNVATKRSHKQELIFLFKQSVQWRCLLAGCFFATAVVLSHFMIVMSYTSGARFQISAPAVVSAVCLMTFISPFVASVFRYGLKLRILGVGLFSLLVQLYWQINYATQTVMYKPDLVWQDNMDKTDDTMVGDNKSKLIVCITDACLCMAFVFMQYVSMRFSQKSMLEARTKMRNICTKADIRLGRAETISKERDGQVSKQSAWLNLSDNALYLLRQLHAKNYDEMKVLNRTVQCLFLTSHILEDFTLPLSLLSFVPNVSHSATCAVDEHNERVSHVRRADSAQESESNSVAALREQARVCPSNRKLSLVRPLLGLFGPESLPAHQPSLHEVLGNTFYSVLFKQHISKSRSLNDMNSFVFYLIARRYREALPLRLRQLIIYQLIQTFVIEKSPRSIRLTPATRHTILLRITDGQTSGDASLFVAAENETFALIEVTSFKSFCNSAEYRLCCWFSTVAKITNHSAPTNLAKSQIIFSDI